jgi:hypothetical protein
MAKKSPKYPYPKQAAVAFPVSGREYTGLVVECSRCGDTHVINGVSKGVRRMPCGWGINIVSVMIRKDGAVEEESPNDG